MTGLVPASNTLTPFLLISIYELAADDTVLVIKFTKLQVPALGIVSGVCGNVVAPDKLPVNTKVGVSGKPVIDAPDAFRCPKTVATDINALGILPRGAFNIEIDAGDEIALR